MTQTPAIYLMPNGGGYATIASLNRDELGVLRDRIDDVLRGAR